MTSEPIRRLRDENPPENCDLREALTNYLKPLLLAIAADEQSISPADDVEYVRTHARPNVVLRVFEGHGHNLHRTDFERFIAATDEFLRARD